MKLLSADMYEDPFNPHTVSGMTLRCKVQSETNVSKSYIVYPGSRECDCLSWLKSDKWGKKHCKHLDFLGVPMPSGPEPVVDNNGFEHL